MSEELRGGNSELKVALSGNSAIARRASIPFSVRCLKMWVNGCDAFDDRGPTVKEPSRPDQPQAETRPQP